MDADEFIEHFGKKGMRWGVSTSTRQANARTAGMGARQLKSESQRIAAAGGGVKGTLAVRREMIANGELSKQDAHAGMVRFGRNLAVGILGSAAVGAAIGTSVGKILVRNLG